MAKKKKKSVLSKYEIDVNQFIGQAENFATINTRPVNRNVVYDTDRYACEWNGAYHSEINRLTHFNGVRSIGAFLTK